MRAKLFGARNIASECVAAHFEIAYSDFRYIAYILAVRRIVGDNFEPIGGITA